MSGFCAQLDVRPFGRTNRRFEAEGSIIGLVVVAYENPCLVGECVEPLVYGAIEIGGAPRWKIATAGSVVLDEERVSCKERIAYLKGHARRGVTRGRDDPHRKRARVEHFPVL